MQSPVSPKQSPVPKEQQAVAQRVKYPGAEMFLPKTESLTSLRQAASACQGCDLHVTATQTVFGAGAEGARVVFIGEQPGDTEDREGRPFVGPAGRIFEQALAAAELSRSETYVTNAVKHFSFEQRGKVRLQKRPNIGQIRACAPWLTAELGAIRPHVVVFLGATAAQSVFGAGFKLLSQRGKPLNSNLATLVLATLHPSAILRAPNPDARRKSYLHLVADLRLVTLALRDELGSCNLSG